MVQLSTPWGDPNRGMGPREALFVKLAYFDLLLLEFLLPVFSSC